MDWLLKEKIKCKGNDLGNHVNPLMAKYQTQIVIQKPGTVFVDLYYDIEVWFNFDTLSHIILVHNSIKEDN